MTALLRDGRGAVGGPKLVVQRQDDLSAQDVIDLEDRSNAPSERELHATELGRRAAQVDRLARQFSGPNVTSVLAVIDALESSEHNTAERLDLSLQFLSLLESGLVVFDAERERFRANFRAQPGFALLWGDQDLRRRFSAAFVEEERQLDAGEAIAIGMLSAVTILGLLGPFVRGVRSQAARLTLRFFHNRPARSAREATALVNAVRAHEGSVTLNIGGRLEHPNAIIVNYELARGSRPYAGRQIHAHGENLKDLLPEASVDAIVSRDLIGDIDWDKIAASAHHVTKPGGPVTIRPWANQFREAPQIVESMERAGFRNVQELRGPTGQVIGVHAVR